MDDLIRRQDAIAIFARREREMFEIQDTYLAGAMHGAQHLMASLPSAQQWIPAHNIFPGVNGKYLVTGKHGAVNIIKYEDGRWYGGTKPIAWMPLPSPYREEANE